MFFLSVFFNHLLLPHKIRTRTDLDRQCHGEILGWIRLSLTLRRFLVDWVWVKRHLARLTASSLEHAAEVSSART